MKYDYLPCYLMGSIIMAWIVLIDMGFIPIPNFLIKEISIVKEISVVKEIPIEKRVEINVIKYVEKEGMPTSTFIMSINPRIDPIIAKQIEVSIDKHSKTYQLPRKLILSIIKKESSFNPFAKSSVAMGLMQIYPKFHREKIKALGINDDQTISYRCQY